MDKQTERAVLQRLSNLEKEVHRLSSDLRKQHNKSASENDDSSHEDQGTPGQPAVVTPPPKNPRSAKDGRHASTQKWKRAIGKFRWWRTLEGLGIVGVIWYAVVSHLEWRDLRHNFTIDERAWLRFKTETKLPELDKTTADNAPAHFLIDVMNVGKTPAVHIAVSSDIVVIGRDQSPSFNYASEHTWIADTGILFQNISLPADFGSPVPLTESQRKSLAMGDSYIVYYGKINYSDGFGMPHETRVCWWRAFGKGSYNAKACTDYNHADTQ